MAWIPIGAWIAAAVVAVVLLGFCAYEIAWKTRRLRRDVAQLQAVSGQLTEIAGQLAGVRERVAGLR